MSGFTHLHVHTEYSLLDGASRIEDLVLRAKELGMDSLAITDHGAMYGVVDFYKAAKKHGIKPIIGCEVYVAPRGHKEKEGRADKEYAHFILLAENEKGYYNLIKLVSLGFTEGFYYKPRIDYDLLEQYSEGLIGLSACIGGDIPQLLLNGMEEEAKVLALRLKNILGPDNFFIEIQDHGLREERQVNPQLIKLARELDLGIVCTNDSHYTRREDAEAHDILLCIQTGKTVDDPNRMRFEGDGFYLKSEEEMRGLFPDLPEALENTVKIAERCNFDYVFGELKLPYYKTPDSRTAVQFMRDISREGLIKKYGQPSQEVLERYEYEMNMIEKMGYVDYYLIVWDYIHYAKTHDIMVGPGRGSGAGSIVAYAMDITTVDPIKYNLLFERFLNPERVSMPDFDVDFPPDGRGKVIEYVTQKYGADNVAQIITFGTMGARMVVRDVGRAMNIPYNECDRIAKLIPHELNVTLSDALERSPDLKKELESEQVAKLIEYSLKLEGLPRHSSTHAAGVVISKEPVDSYVPLAINDNVPVTQFTMKTLEQLGLLKMDFLGLRTLAVIKDTLDLVKNRTGEMPDIYNISFDDAKVYAMLAKGDTDGVFQLESTGMRNFMRELGPSTFEDIIAGIALYRPGPMESIPRYVKGKKDPGSVEYLHPILEPVLNVTYGCIVYQEQVMQIVRDVAGYSLGRSDVMRRAMSKKDKAVMEREHEIFIHGLEENGQIVVPGAVRNGIPEKIAEEMFEQIRTFAQYAFNKSHAAAYAVVAYETAYLKYYYPSEFMAAMLNSFLGDGSRAAQYIQYCRDNLISVLPPDINESGAYFTVTQKGAVRFGMAAVKNVGVNAVEAIVKEREANGPFKGIYDFARRCMSGGGEINKRAVECLIKAGAFDSSGFTRRSLLSSYESIIDQVQAGAKRMVEGQLSFFTEELESELDSEQENEIPKLPEYEQSYLLSLEKEMLGIYVSGHPLEKYKNALKRANLTTAMLMDEEELQLNGIYDGKEVEYLGIISAVRTKITKSNNLMAFVTAEDNYGALECLVFPNVYTRYRDKLVPDKVVRLKGRLSMREDEQPKIILDAAYEVQPDGETSRIWIRITDENRAALNQLDVFMAGHEGGCRVILYYEKERGQKELEGRISGDEQVLAGLRRLFGEQHVKIR